MKLDEYLKAHGFKSYNEYLLSDEWKKLREKALNKYHNRCVICGDKEKLQVHHLNYKNIEIPDLVVLCTDCHKFFHEVIQDKCFKALRKLDLELAEKYVSLELEYRRRTAEIIASCFDEFITRKQKPKVADINVARTVFGEILQENRTALYGFIYRKADSIDISSIIERQIVELVKAKNPALYKSKKKLFIDPALAEHISRLEKDK